MAKVEYPDNTFASKSEKKEENRIPEKKEIVSPVQGNVRTKKRSEFRKFIDSFIAEDFSTLKTYAVRDVVIPTAKKAISDIISNGIDIILYGEGGRNRRSSGQNRVSYRDFYVEGGRPNRPDRSERRGQVADYDDIIFDSRADADAVLDQMIEIVSSYGKISVADMYDIAHVSTNNFSLNNYGWYDLSGCRSVRERDGYVLRLPRPVAFR